MESREIQSPQFIKFEDRIISVINIDNRSYHFYRSTGVNSQYKNTWFPMRGLIDTDKVAGWIRKPPILSSDLGYYNAIARLKFSKPTNAEKKAVVMHEEVLVIKDDNNNNESPYIIGFCNKEGKYEEKNFEDPEFSKWMSERTNEGWIGGTGINNKINKFIQLNGQIVNRRSYSLSQLKSFYKNSYDPEFIEYLYLHQFDFKVKADTDSEINPISEFLGRFGNMECLCISYLIGGGFWESKESEMIKNYINKVYSLQLAQLSKFGDVIDAFQHPIISREYTPTNEDYNTLSLEENNTISKINTFLDDQSNYPVDFSYDFNSIHKEKILESVKQLNKSVGSSIKIDYLDEINESKFDKASDIQRFVDECNKTLDQYKSSLSKPLEDSIKSLKNNLQSLLVHTDKRNVKVVDGDGAYLTFAFPEIDNQNKMLLNLQECIHALFKDQPQYFIWRMEIKDNPKRLDCFCECSSQMNFIAANYDFINKLSHAGLLDEHANNEYKKIIMNNANFKKTGKNSKIIAEFQSIYNEIKTKKENLGQEKTGFFLFSSTASTKGMKEQLLGSVEDHLKKILQHSDLKNLDFDLVIQELHDNIELIKRKYDNSALEGVTLKLIKKLETVIESNRDTSRVKPQQG